MRLLTILAIAILAGPSCSGNKEAAKKNTCFKGKLEIKGGCMNYTISLQEGTLDPSLYAKEWTDENTGKRYENVFALDSKCNFPTTIKEGDSFYFTIDSLTDRNCAVCMMYYPVPPKRLAIKVQNEPCPN